MDDHRKSKNTLVHPPNVINFRQTLSTYGTSSLELLNTHFMWIIPIAFLLLSVAGPMWVLCFKKEKVKKTMVSSIKNVSAGKFCSPEAFSQKYTGIDGVVDDYQYSMDLQIQEVLMASLSSQVTSAASSSTQARRPFNLDSGPVKIENEVANPSQISCEVCLEDKKSWEMFRNDSCHHSFCYECTSKHIIAKIQDNPKTIRCLGADCNATLDINTCRSMIPKDVLAKWDEFLCQSLIPNSQKLFCPFRDCSAMLIDDSGEVIKEIKCPLCWRSFCAACRVPWHSEFTCKEFQKLNAKKGGNDEKMLKFLAKKKSWQKCPSCKIHVERNEGCLHMTCRCTYEFCYRCGSKWSGSHACKKS